MRISGCYRSVTPSSPDLGTMDTVAQTYPYSISGGRTMNLFLRRGLLGLGLAFVAAALVAAEPPKEAPKETPKKELPFTISGPYVKDNLSIFLFHGKDTL